LQDIKLHFGKFLSKCILVYWTN